MHTIPKIDIKSTPNNISLRDVAFGYRTQGSRSVTEIARGINACAKAGELTCLIGRNGIGKSTLLRCAARLQDYSDGCIAVGGRRVEDLSASELAQTISIVLTRRPETANATVEELVALGRAPYTNIWGTLKEDDRRQVDAAIESVGMTHMRSRRALSLSDGEMQKVLIAKSMAQRTAVIILDEPTAFLDFPAKVEMLRTLRRLAHEQGKTIIMSTHDIEIALQTADRIWLMQKDGIVEGTPKDIVKNGDLEAYIGDNGVCIDKDTMALRIENIV